MKRPLELYGLMLLHFILTISGLTGGIMLILEPQGSLLKINTLLLRKTPFSDYFFPGLILFMLNGLFPLFTLVGLIVKRQWRGANLVNIYADKYWGWTYSLFTGIILITWIAIQLLIIPYLWLQPTLICIGVLIIIFTMLPGVIKFYTLNHKL